MRASHWRGQGVGGGLLEGLEAAAAELGCTCVRPGHEQQAPPARSAGYPEIPDYNQAPGADYWLEKAVAEPER